MATDLQIRIATIEARIRATKARRQSTEALVRDMVRLRLLQLKREIRDDRRKSA